MVLCLILNVKNLKSFKFSLKMGKVHGVYFIEILLVIQI